MQMISDDSCLILVDDSRLILVDDSRLMIFICTYNEFQIHSQRLCLMTLVWCFAKDFCLMLCKRLLSDALQKTFVWCFAKDFCLMTVVNAFGKCTFANAFGKCTFANAFRKWSSLFAITVLMIVKCIRKWFSMTVYALSKCLLIQCLAHVRRLRTVSNDHRSKGLSKLHSFSLLQLLT